ncbi:hypothetical protein CLOM_g12476 [Closterium sp. NIES-68]|nr:hypothetical protein CLOM_g12476 [Closterium sp. NIES-68]
MSTTSDCGAEQYGAYRHDFVRFSAVRRRGRRRQASDNLSHRVKSARRLIRSGIPSDDKVLTSCRSTGGRGEAGRAVQRVRGEERRLRP